MSASHEPPPVVVECSTCAFYHHKTTRQVVSFVGHCRRFPPQVVYDVTEDGKDNAFPMVRAKDWCGEYQSVHAEQYDEEV